MLVRLLYASRATDALTVEMVEAILAQSRRKNPEVGITGILCFSQDVFMQVLEGGRREVCDLYHLILRDTRHCQPTLLHFEEISERRFASWTMGQVNLSRVNPSTMLKYSERPVLDPFSATGRVALALLEELMDTASIIGRPG